MKLEVSCAMCGKEKSIQIAEKPEYRELTVEEAVKTAGWIVQVNGDNLDLYCSGKCAS